MQEQEFKDAIRRLEAGLGKQIQPDRRDILFNEVKYWSNDKLTKVVHKLIRTYEGIAFPQIATILKAAEEFQEYQPKKTLNKQECEFCDSIGVVWARDEQQYDVVFKCPFCSNKDINIPVWSSQPGYTLESKIIEVDFTQPKFIKKEEPKEEIIDEVYNF